jgi:hypothetical protein
MPRRSAILISFAFLFLYFAAYLALLKPAHCTILDGASGRRVRYPMYRIGGSLTATVFRPVLWLDHKIRPLYWAWEELPYGASCMIEKDEVR